MPGSSVETWGEIILIHGKLAVCLLGPRLAHIKLAVLSSERWRLQSYNYLLVILMISFVSGSSEVRACY